MAQVNAVSAWSVLLRLKVTCSCSGDFSTFSGITGHSPKWSHESSYINTPSIFHLCSMQNTFWKNPYCWHWFFLQEPPVNIWRLLNWKKLALRAPLFPLSHPPSYSSERWVSCWSQSIAVVECSFKGRKHNHGRLPLRSNLEAITHIMPASSQQLV